LRIRVFRDHPYLYNGDPAYERTYLEAYIQSPATRIAGVNRFVSKKALKAPPGSIPLA
jgi:hypothetical protein